MAYGKDELFATHEAAYSNRAKYIKTFAVAAVVGVIILGAVLYFGQAQYGDLVRPPAGLEDAVRSYFFKTEKMEAAEVNAYLCEGAYGIEAWVTPPNNSTAGKVKRNAIAVTTGTDPMTWEIKPGPTDPAQGPCGLYQ
jgi:hypothetical protein